MSAAAEVANQLLVRLCVCLFVVLHVCLFVCLFVSLFVCLFFCVCSFTCSHEVRNHEDADERVNNNELVIHFFFTRSLFFFNLSLLTT